VRRLAIEEYVVARRGLPHHERVTALVEAATLHQSELPAPRERECKRLNRFRGANNDHVMPGWSVHEELEALVRAGLTPAEALRLATINAAAWRGDTNEGEIAK
jgi:hypothetical protein